MQNTMPSCCLADILGIGGKRSQHRRVHRTGCECDTIIGLTPSPQSVQMSTIVLPSKEREVKTESFDSRFLNNSKCPRDYL